MAHNNRGVLLDIFLQGENSHILLDDLRKFISPNSNFRKFNININRLKNQPKARPNHLSRTKQNSAMTYRIKPSFENGSMDEKT